LYCRQAGLEVGQEIIAVDAEPTPTEQALQKQLLNRLGESGAMFFKVRYPNSELQYEVQVSLDKWMQGVKDPEPLQGLGLALAYPLKAVVGELTPNGVAEQAGFKTGDKILRVDQLAVKDWRDWVGYVRAHPKHSLAVTVERENRTLELRLTPEYFTEPESFQKKAVSYGRVGMAMQPQTLPDELFRQYDYSIGGALVAGVKRTWETSGFVLLSVKKLILGEISTKNLSGPISIAKVAGSSAQNGLKSFVGFVALLSVFLGVFNLLPIPVLDGGHLLYLFIEVIKGKPVSEKLQVLSYQVGIMLVIGLSVVAMYNDIMRL
ncbi:MAG: RIP metalloprotease RseP, partial [Moraxellaceae bacterium]